MKIYLRQSFSLFFTLLLLAGCTRLAAAQAKAADDDIYGVRIGMDVPTALASVFQAAQRKPGQEKPDAMKKEGKGDKDIRVVYHLDKGDLFILFADGKVVKEILLQYTKFVRRSELHLAPNGNLYNATDGQRYDDRYSIGFTSNKQQERLWWRDEKQAAGYRIRVSYISPRLKGSGEVEVTAEDIAKKLITVVPEDLDKFNQAMTVK